MPHLQRAVETFFGQAAAEGPRSRPGGGARRRDPGQRARGQSRAGRRLAAAGRDPAFAGARDHGRAGGARDSAQFHDSRGARAGVHHVQGRPDRDGDPRRAGRARAGGRLPLARALRAARHPADGGGGGAHPGHVPGGRRRAALGVGAREDHGRRIVDRGEAFLRAFATTRSRACCRRAFRTPARIATRARSPSSASRPNRCSRRCAPRSGRMATCCGARSAPALDAGVAALERARDGTDYRAIKSAIEALNRASEAFAARRMDRADRAGALAGRSVDEVREMTKLTVLPHETFCPEGAVDRGAAGTVDLRLAPRPATSTSSTPASRAAPARPAT